MRIEMEAGAAKVIGRLKGAGYAAYAVGGCVRDALLGKPPSDWDICTSALPEQTLALFGEGSCIPTGIKHGTVTVRMDGGFYEVTTFRTDGTYTDGRHPDSVDFVADVREDLARRDFTINAMAYNDQDGLVDPFGGREDLLVRRVVRAVGDPMLRFEEDALRVMRLFRFAARFGFAIDGETERAARALCGNLSRVSVERIREELMKLLETEKPAAYLPRCVVCVFLPEMAGVSDAAYERALGALDALAPDAQLRLGALLSPLCSEGNAGPAIEVLRRLRCSKKMISRASIALQGALDAYDGEDEMALRTRARFALGAHGLHAVYDIGALGAVLREAADAQRIAQFVAFAEDAQARCLCCRIRDLAVSGTDVKPVLGKSVGAMVGKLLERLLEGVIREELENERDALLAAAKRLLSEEREQP